MHIAVSTVNVKASSKYFIIIFFLRRGFRTNPSKPYHAPHMDFVLVCFLFFGLAQWYRGTPRETDETLTLSCTVMQFNVWCFGHIKQPIDLEIGSTKGSWKYHHVTPSLRDLFSLFDLWYSSQSPSHRPSTSEPCVLQLSLSQTTPHRNSVGD